MSPTPHKAKSAGTRGDFNGSLWTDWLNRALPGAAALALAASTTLALPAAAQAPSAPPVTVAVPLARSVAQWDSLDSACLAV